MQHRTQYFGFLFKILSQVSTLNILSLKQCSTKFSNSMDLAKNLKVIADSSLFLCEREHQYISSINVSGQATCCCLLCFQMSACDILSIFFFFFFWKHLLSEPKNHHWGRDLSVYEHTWKAIFLHIKKLIFYVHCRERNRTLWSYVLDFEEHNQSDFTLRNEQWQMLGCVIWKKVVPCCTLHVHQITRFAK